MIYINNLRITKYNILQDVNFSSSTPGVFVFWNQISHNLLSLEIHRSYVTETNLLNILLCCHSLESLHFHDCRDTFITGKLFNNELVLSHIKQAMPKLKALGFSENSSYLSDALLDRFMSLVVNLAYLSFSGTTISFHPGINKKFYSENIIKEGSTSSELVLTFDCILQHIAEHSVTVKYLDFSQTQIDDKSCVSLSKVAIFSTIYSNKICQIIFFNVISYWFCILSCLFKKDSGSQTPQPFIA